MKIETLDQIFTADFKKQKLFWKERPAFLFNSTTQSKEHNAKAWNAKFAGKEALTNISHGYYNGSLFNRRIYKHQVIFALYHRIWPSNIDHVDGNSLNNSIDNLRNVEHKINMRNRRKPSNNTSGHVGVYPMSYGGYVAKMSVSGKTISKSVATIEEACAFLEKHRTQNGFHQNHGRD